MAIVEGFGGMRIRDNKLCFNPLIPEQWENYSFNLKFRGKPLITKVSKKEVLIENMSDKNVHLSVYGNEYKLKGNEKKIFERK